MTTSRKPEQEYKVKFRLKETNPIHVILGHEEAI